jgi:hypothetical protein
MLGEKRSWTQKVDPAFPKFIKFYLEFLTLTQLPENKGYIAIDDRNLKTLELEGFPSLASVYEHDNVEDAVIDFGVVVDDPITSDGLNEMKKGIKKKDNIFTSILELAEMMDEESRKYYLEAFDIFSSEEKYKQYISDKNETEVKKLGRKGASDIKSFILHWIVIPLEDAKEEIKKRIQLRNFTLSTRMIKRHLFYTWDAVSLMVNGEALKVLYKKAKDGDNESLFKLIKVDKTLFDHKWVRSRINQEAYSGGIDFFDALGDAIKTDPLKHGSRKNRIDKLFLAIKFYWEYGLYRLSDYELHEMLIDDSICSELETHQNVESFIKFLQRHRAYLPK